MVQVCSGYFYKEELINYVNVGSLARAAEGREIWTHSGSKGGDRVGVLSPIIKYA